MDTERGEIEDCGAGEKSVSKGGEMSKQRVRLTLPGKLHSEPIIYNIGQQFNLVTNIYQADLPETGAG